MINKDKLTNNLCLKQILKTTEVECTWLLRGRLLDCIDHRKTDDALSAQKTPLEDGHHGCGQVIYIRKCHRIYRLHALHLRLIHID